MEREEYFSSYINTVPDFPKEGIMFRDWSPLLADPLAFEDATVDLEPDDPPEFYIGIDSRGYILATSLAYLSCSGIVMCRKAGKLPPPVVQQSYDLEYGQATLEMAPIHMANKPTAWIVDDLIATGGSAIAAIELAEKAGYDVKGVIAVIDLPDLGGARKIIEKGYAVRTLVHFDGE